MMRTVAVPGGLLVALVWAVGCGGGEPLRVTTVDLGRSLNSDNSVGIHTTRFKPDQAIYASVHTTGSGSATMVARWLYSGRMVSETKKDVSYTREAATEFHIQNPSGFPPGQYTVEIVVNGGKVDAKEFRVEK
jgi:hypothetical protein